VGFLRKTVYAVIISVLLFFEFVKVTLSTEMKTAAPYVLCRSKNMKHVEITQCSCNSVSGHRSLKEKVKTK
jgi:hypothetical protein